MTGSELTKRIWYTLGALVMFRFGTYIPLPGIDPATLADLFRQQSGGILGLFDMLAGGAFGRMTIFGVGIMPYIEVAIIVQVLAALWPRFARLKNGSETDRKKITRYTRYGTVILAVLQAYGIALGLESMIGSTGSAVTNPGIVFRLTTVLMLVGGTLFLMWLGNQITLRGIGNGISLILFAGIVANLPHSLVGTLELSRVGALPGGLIIGLFVLVISVVTFIVCIEHAQSRIVVRYPKRQWGDRMLGGAGSHLPLKINASGMIPPIFASALLLPIAAAGFPASSGPSWMKDVGALLGPNEPLYMVLYALLIVLFAFLYAAVAFNPTDAAENLRKYGGFIPGIQPGGNTADYLGRVVTRLTVVGAAYLALISILPQILIVEYGVPFYFGGTSLLIAVTVAMDTVAQIRSQRASAA